MIRSQAVTYVQAHVDEVQVIDLRMTFIRTFQWERSDFPQKNKMKGGHLMSVEENKKVQRQVFEALNRKDANGAGELSALECKFYGFASHTLDLDGYIQFTNGVRNKNLFSVFFQERSSARYAPDRASHRDTPPVRGYAE